MSVEQTAERGSDAAPPRALEVRLFVDAAWREGRAGWLPVTDPATGLEAGRVALADPEDVRGAVAAAQAAFNGWAATPAAERGAVLKRAARLMTERSPRIAGTLSLEGGKTTAEALGEVSRAAETLAWNGEEAGRIEGRVISGKAPASQRLAVPGPVGVVAAFTAWNFPAVLTTRKLGAALASGCTAVLKASETTPGTAAEVVRALTDAGAPRGVVNLIFGDPAAISEQLIGSWEVRAVTFTGSTAVGRIVAGHAAKGPKRTVLELGGHAPVIVDADGDVELAISATLPAKFGSAGQSCVAPSRYFIHESRFEEFTDRFTEEVGALRIGAFTEDGVNVGPVIDAGRVAALEQQTRDAVARGARLCCGGRRVERTGFFFAPTVLADVPADAGIMHEEPFGPIAVLNRFGSLDEAIAKANSTHYAFAAYIFTDSLRTRQRVIAELHASNVGINQMAPSLPDVPLGGMQASGVGYEGGRDGIAAFQHLRLISETAA
jgi:succinate-semialdehyde dehydrogenase/glutarate-semialdehyde dehydrogenase